MKNVCSNNDDESSTCAAESESLRSLLGGREAEAATLREQARKEREELVTRLLQDKGRSAIFACFSFFCYVLPQKGSRETIGVVVCSCNDVQRLH